MSKLLKNAQEYRNNHDDGRTWEDELMDKGELLNYFDEKEKQSLLDESFDAVSIESEEYNEKENNNKKDNPDGKANIGINSKMPTKKRPDTANKNKAITKMGKKKNRKAIYQQKFDLICIAKSMYPQRPPTFYFKYIKELTDILEKKNNRVVETKVIEEEPDCNQIGVKLKQKSSNLLINADYHVYT